jgi:4-diphosphocytidyl-2C-methyl-D-erythritol kinase
MEPGTAMLAAAGISAGGQLLGGYLGNKAQSKGLSAAAEQYKQQLAMLQSIGLPPDISRPLIIEELKQQGVYTPELEDEIVAIDSEWQQAQEDASLRNAQLKALQKFQDISQTGLGAEDRAALNQIRRELGSEAQAKQEQIMQNMAARGLSGSGSELAAQLSAQQAANELASQQGDELVKLATQRALNALSSGADLAGNVRTSDLAFQGQKNEAIDAFNRFNQQNTIQQQQRNIQALNQAQKLNLGEQQRIADANALARNAEAERQRQAEMKEWDARLRQVGGQGGTYANLANIAKSQGQNQANLYSGIGQAIGGAVSTYGQYQQQPVNTNPYQVNYNYATASEWS